jgi:hypothetical protein
MQTVLPSLQTEEQALPVVNVEINGLSVKAFIDSGGDTFSVPQEVAAASGLKILVTSSGVYAGGAAAEHGYTKADSLKLDDVAVRNLPVEIELIHCCSIGTDILRQFPATFDYPTIRLILRPKNERGRQLLHRDLAGKTMARFPSTLMGTHLMFTQRQPQ